VELVEPLGSETLVHGRLADGAVLLVKLQGAVRVAERIEIMFDPSAVHLFDAVTGVRL
jgi:sn-glycerol 3-phosphate transport system ATP-binding protein